MCTWTLQSRRTASWKSRHSSVLHSLNRSTERSSKGGVGWGGVGVGGRTKGGEGRGKLGRDRDKPKRPFLFLFQGEKFFFWGGGNDTLPLCAPSPYDNGRRVMAPVRCPLPIRSC